MTDAKLVAVGRLGRAHGVRGEVRLDPLGGLPRGLEGYTRFYLGDRNGSRIVALESWRPSGRHLLVKLDGVDTPEAVRAVSGATLYVVRAEMPPLEPGEYYHVDLLGCAVRDEEGRDLGSVVDVLATVSYDLLVVDSGGREWMVPVVDQHVPTLDLERRVIVVRSVDEFRA